jgi:hypothetical protein
VTYAGQNDKYGRTYAGQCRDGYACGLGVATDSDGRKVYAEHGPDGQFDGRCLVRWDDGLTGYRLFERGEGKDSAYVFADGRCKYNREACAPDDPRLLALIAQVGPVEVRPAAPAPHPPSPCHSPPSNRPTDRPARFFCSRRRWRPPWPPRCTPHSARRRWWLRNTTQQQPHCKARPRSDAHTGFFAVLVSWEAPCCTLTTAAWCTPMGPSRQHRCPAIVQHAAC